MDFLKELGIEQNNYGACVGGKEWIKTGKGKKLDSVNPSTGEIIASVYQATDTDYEKVMKVSEDAFNQWKKVPAPVRGQLVREIADALREKKDALGSLV
ncbi:MAG TPA: aldehyde dehydrogenase family protein, partial [Candidatus Marinimicrobia bacterium]|nr:aldehyde dehydrogenase family protein [Candidatus Neomarinimicrobiota bacterium]